MSDVALAGPRGSLPAGIGAGSTESISLPNISRPAAFFAVIPKSNSRDFAFLFFAKCGAKTVAAGGPPPLGLHILMGRNAPDKIQNMIQNVASGRIAPVELIARKV